MSDKIILKFNHADSEIIGKKNKSGRPTKYDPKYIDEAELYLKECRDEYEMIEEYEEVDGMEVSDDNGKEYMKGRTKKRKKSIMRVKLPSIGRFALRLKVNRDTLYNWAEEHEEFLGSLEDIKAEQKERLKECGLSGEYNSTIAKLILSSNHGMRERTDVTSDDKVIGTDKDKVKKTITEYLNDNNGNTNE